MGCNVGKATEGLEMSCDVCEVTERLENELCSWAARQVELTEELVT